MSMHLRTLSTLIFLLLGLTLSAQAKEVVCPPSATQLAPLKYTVGGEPRTLALCDVYRFHGGVCPGATMTFRAVGYGLELLFGDETPELADLLIINKAPGGPMDLLDLMIKGDNPTLRTWPPTGMTNSADNFSFQFLRKSNLKMVTVELNQGLWPDDWFDLRNKNREGTISPEEEKKRLTDRQQVINTFPTRSYAELFGQPQVETFVIWGEIEPGEMDKRIRDYRRRNRG